MAVRYHGCTCHLRHGQQNQQQTSDDGRYTLNNGYSSGRGGAETFSAGSKSLDDDEDSDEQKSGESTQPWYFHLIASCILVIHGLTFLVPGDGDQDDTDMVRTLASWMGYDMDWVKHFTPYAQGLAAVFNISLGLVSWWTPKGSDRYNRLIQLRVFVFCLNILHAYITGPIIFQNNDEGPLVSTGKGFTAGRIIGLFRLSYLTPGLMAAGVTEVIVEKEGEQGKEEEVATAIQEPQNVTAVENKPSRSERKRRK